MPRPSTSLPSFSLFPPLFNSRKDRIRQFAKFLGCFLGRFALRFVDRLQEFVPAICRDIFLAQKICPELAVADPDDEIFFRESERAQDVDAKRNEFDISGKIRLHR